MKKYLLIIVTVLTALLMTQCSKRENPADISNPSGTYWSLFFESSSIRDDIMQDYWFRSVTVYTPPGYDPADTLRGIVTDVNIMPPETLYEDPGNPDSITQILPPDTIYVYGDTALGTYYPVLYLLHGYGGNDTYFKGLYSIANVMDELINSDQVEPMIVVTPDASNALKGSFYTNSPEFGGRSYAGRMQDFLTNEVVPFIDTTFNTLTDRTHRGIAGHSMGGYGAVKLAMLRNDLFGSAAAMSAPLTFHGDVPVNDTLAQFNGLWALLPSMFAENSFTPGIGDTAGFYAITPGTGKSLTNMMFAMGAAFSPHYLPSDPDTTYAHRFAVPGYIGYIDLPFDINGDLVPSVWNLWMANDVLGIFLSGGAAVFDSTSLYIDCGDADQLAMNYHAQTFYAIANNFAPGAVDQFSIYSGFDDLFAADHTTFIAERLKEVARFHSLAFNPAR